MKKKNQSSLFVILVVLQFLISTTLCLNSVFAVKLTEQQNQNIVTNCDSIISKLKDLQKEDSHVRTYLGNRYDAILSNFVTPFNKRLVSNNFADTDVKSQSAISSYKTTFSNDFINYQKSLENLINTGTCKSDPSSFYEELNIVRAKRKTVYQDVLKMQDAISGHVIYVNQLKASLR